jgi:hypothetical protein
MKPQNLHAHEDRLLDFAYGELPQAEAHAMEVHLQGCARCSEALDGIRGVRTTMSQLSAVDAPDAGLDSLLAYAQQAARRAAAGPEPTPSRWRRWLMPAMGLTAVSFLGIFSLQVSKGVDLQPSYSELATRHDAARAERAKDSAPPKLEEVSQQALIPTDKEASSARPPPSPAAAAPLQQPMPEAREMAKLEDLPTPERSVRGMKKKGSSYSSDLRSDWGNAGSGYGPELRADSRKRDAKELPSLGTRGEAQALAPAPTQVAEAAPRSPAQGLMPPEEPMVAQAAPAADMDAESDASYAAEAVEQKAEPPRSKLRIGGSTAQRGSGSAPTTAGSAAVEGLALEDMAPTASPGGAAVASATPAPSKPRPSAPAAATESADAFDDLFATKRAARKSEAESPASVQLSRRAGEAYRAGNRTLEASLLRQALVADPSERERLDLLVRLCDAEFALGRREAAIETCEQVVAEDPRSSAAQVARRRLNEVSGETARSKQAAPANAAPASSNAVKK